MRDHQRISADEFYASGVFPCCRYQAIRVVLLRGWREPSDPSHPASSGIRTSFVLRTLRDYREGMGFRLASVHFILWSTREMKS